MTVTSPKRRPRIAIFASILLVAFVAQLPGAFAQAEPKANGPSSPASKFSGVGASLGIFGPRTPAKHVRAGKAGRFSSLMCFGHQATIIGTNGNDRLYGTKGNDVIIGMGGADLISAGLGADLICGGIGDDQLYGLAGRDKLDGGEGADTISGGDDNDYLYGDGGDDSIDGEGGTDYIYGGNDQDTLFGGTSGDIAPAPTPTATASPGASPAPTGGGGGALGADSIDYVYGGPGGDTLDGGDMNDNLYGQGANDTLMGQDGNDRMVGGPGRDVFDGGAGNDTMTGAAGDDSFDGGEGNDTVYGDAGQDDVEGGAGEDTVYGGLGDDLLNGGDGGDTLHGDGDDDIVCGGDGRDSLYGSDGNDFISGEGDCVWNGAGLGSVFVTDANTVSNLINGGTEVLADVCVNPSEDLSPQTVNCESGPLSGLNLTVVGGSGDNVTGTADGNPTDLFGKTIKCDRTAPSGTCSFFFIPGAAMVLTANDGTGTFQAWGGGCVGIVSPCAYVAPSGITAVTATFDVPTLTVSKSGPGTVTSIPAGISCGATCSATFSSGTTITSLTVTGATTVVWNGTCPVAPVGAVCGPFLLTADTTVNVTTT
jgi:Ca2+-binding RTX toxin-like protein